MSTKSVTTYTCDHCGKEEKSESWRDRGGETWFSVYRGNHEDYDLCCRECLTAWSPPEPTPSSEEPPP